MNKAEGRMRDMSVKGLEMVNRSPTLRQLNSLRFGWLTSSDTEQRKQLTNALLISV